MEQWPEQYLPNTKTDDLDDVESEVESFFSEYYGYQAIFFPSARSALFHLSIYYKIDRNQEIFIPRWSSHCLYNALGLIGTPSVHSKTPKLILVNHKWGYLHSAKGASQDIPIIEDSVDSLIVNRKGLFQTNGEFEIISLAKLTGLPGGCIVFMKSKESKRELRAIIDKQNNPELNEIFWYYKKKFLLNGKVSQSEFQISNQLEPLIARATLDQLRSFEGIEKNYLEVLEVVSKRYYQVLRYKNLLPLESQGSFQNANRIPTIIPVYVTDKMLLELSCTGITLEKRYFDFNLNPFEPDYKSTYFLPIHIGVSDRDFEILVSILFKPNDK